MTATLTLWMQTSLDGRAEGPNGEFDWPTVGDDMTSYGLPELRKMGTFLYGRKVFEGMAAFWPDAETWMPDSPFHVAFAQLWKPMPKIVFSRTLTEADWNSRVVRSNVVEEVTKLKAEADAGLVCFGGPDIASTLIGNDLVDEFRLFIHPVVLGGGPSIFPALGERFNLRLDDTRTFDSAVTLVRYSRVRDAATGESPIEPGLADAR